MNVSISKFSKRLLAVGCMALVAGAGSVYAQGTLTAAKVVVAPNIAQFGADMAFGKAPELKIKLNGGANFNGGSTDATLRAVYTKDMIYFLLTYTDPTQSARRSPYVKQADGSWIKLKDPDDKGGDNNKYYEDKVAFIWDIGGSMKGFDKNGCFVTCHAGEQGKPYGNKYTASAGELGDIWHLKTVRTGYIGQADNQYVNHDRYDKDKMPEAGRHSDAKTGGGYADVKLVNGKPEFMNKDGKAANKGGTYYLRVEDKVAFDDGKFVAGDEVASIMVEKFTGDRGVIDAAIKYDGGKWMMVVARPLVTKSKNDVQFDNLGKSYPFGLALFDNAQVRHAFHMGAITLKFAK